MAAAVDDVVVGAKDPVGEPVAPDVPPDVFRPVREPPAVTDLRDRPDAKAARTRTTD